MKKHIVLAFKLTLFVILLLVICAIFLIYKKDAVPEWQTFSSTKAGLKLDLSFEFPSEWSQIGGIDGGTSSQRPFYIKNKYKEHCVLNDDKSESCWEDGFIAKLWIRKKIENSQDLIIKYNSVSENKITTLDGVNAVIQNGFVKDGDNQMNHISLPNKKESRLVIDDIYGNRFEFFMSINNTKDQIIFDHIVNTLKFKKPIEN